MYDTLHTGDRCGQLKCLGKRLRNLVPGDEAALRRSVTDAELAEIGEPDMPGIDATPEELAAWSDHPYTRAVYDGYERPETSWQVPMSDGSFALFEDGCFVGFIDDGPRAGVVIVDNSGHDVAVADIDSSRHGWVSEPGRCDVCDVCERLRAGAPS